MGKDYFNNAISTLSGEDEQFSHELIQENNSSDLLRALDSHIKTIWSSPSENVFVAAEPALAQQILALIEDRTCSSMSLALAK